MAIARAGGATAYVLGPESLLPARRRPRPFLLSRDQAELVLDLLDKVDALVRLSGQEPEDEAEDLSERLRRHLSTRPGGPPAPGAARA
ncbi:hypothetical protein [Nocardiopsis trehalosi]|uniref:hypothetical protein n=1 Tax=Nocardiopsis trehalosi TaxID=109329 RepID=UPI00082E9A17|nr:hypothetical protein [Nocardiopsis trehalosi]